MITASELAELEDQRDTYKSHSLMLGRVGAMVSDFCEENETVEAGVARLLALYHDLKAQYNWDQLESINNKNDSLQ
ncbi:MAG: hypothetical protein E6R03_05260 [Hyphomicrobiaceae bacterium]|nr:MAG: hypothetical protein E6R03_05260 [Hyphomicrobiaceae bacterium]